MSELLAAFKEAPKAKPGKPGCPVCGERNTVQLNLQALAMTDGYAHNSSGYTAQRGIHMCEQHALVLWNNLVEQIMEVRNRDV